MKILIAGLGSIGRRHLRNLLSLGETDISLFRTYRSTLPEEDLAGFPVLTDLDQALAATRIALKMAPLRIRKMRLVPASHEDRTWLAASMDRVCAPFGTRITLAADGTLIADWAGGVLPTPPCPGDLRA